MLAHFLKLSYNEGKQNSSLEEGFIFSHTFLCVKQQFLMPGFTKHDKAIDFLSSSLLSHKPKRVITQNIANLEYYLCFSSYIVVILTLTRDHEYFCLPSFITHNFRSLSEKIRLEVKLFLTFWPRNIRSCGYLKSFRILLKG